MKNDYPNLFIPGAGKSGTSTLHELLNYHPEISMSKIKEPHFWTRLNFEEYTEEDHSRYLALFDQKKNIQYRGESSTGYMQFPNFITRLRAHYNSSPKFIFILRNPIDRCYSHYWWLKGIGSEKLDFRKAILKDFNIEPTHETKLPEANYKSYFQYGLYGKWIKRFYDNFNSDDIKIITTEELKMDRLKTINSCFDFLNLKQLQSIPETNSNKTILLKYPFLYKYAKLITYNKIYLPQLVKDSIPNNIKIYIRKNLMKSVLKYTTTSKEYDKIKKEDRIWLCDLYNQDIKDLKEISGLKFEVWTDFN